MAARDLASPARQRNARGEGDRLRDQLLEATVALLDREGDAERVSVRAIAKAAGVSPTALYLHFADRDALVAAAVDRCFAAFNGALLDALAAAEEPRERVRAMGLAYLRFAERQPALLAVLFSTRRPAERPPAPPDAPPRVPRDEALDSFVRTVAAAAPHAGEPEARELALTFWAAVHGYALLHTRPPKSAWPDPERYVDGLVRAHLDD